MKQVVRALNVDVLIVIDKIEFFIYKFVTSNTSKSTN